MKTRTWITVTCLPAALGLALVAGCGKKESAEEQPPAPATAPSAAPIDPATAAVVAGVVKLDGAAPKAAKIDMSQDPACKGANVAENVVVADSHLANVFVYVKEGLGGRTFGAPKEAITLDQSGCRSRKIFCARRSHAACEVQPASVDEDVRQCLKEPFLRGHWAGRQV